MVVPDGADRNPRRTWGRQLAHGARVDSTVAAAARPARARSELSSTSGYPYAQSQRTAAMHDIRRRVLTALALNRTPGFHFSGNFLGVQYHDITPQHVAVSLDQGAHCEDVDGRTNLAVVALLADVAAASVVRANLTPAQRLATVSLHLQLTGAPLRGPLTARSEFDTFLDGARGRQGLSRVNLEAGGTRVLFGSGAFMVRNPPPGVTMHPITSAVHAGALPLAENALDAAERALLIRTEAALAQSGSPRGFLRELWGLRPHGTATGAYCRVDNGPHIGNRVGHMQGGLQIGLAATTALAALPEHWVLSGISAWFISPGVGRALSATSRVVHRGGHTAVVRTVINGKGRRRVFEAVTTHACGA